MAEPAVVEHEPLDADVCCTVGERDEGAEALLEVHGFPRVEHDGAGRRGMLRARAEVAVEPCGHLVQTTAPRAVDPRRRVGSARNQGALARQEELASAEEAVTGRGPLGERAVIAAPRHMQSPDLASLEGEPRCPCDEKQGGVRTGAPTSALTEVGAQGERVALG